MEFEKKIAVLGSTGSIGTQTLEIAREYKGIKIEAMSAHSNIDLIEKQAREFKPKTVCLTNEEKAKDLKIKLAAKRAGQNIARNLIARPLFVKNNTIKY